MTRLSFIALFAFTTACNGAGPDEDSGPSDTGTTEDSGTVTGQTTAVITTVSSDSTTGGFATISLDDWTVDDELFPTSGDAAVSSDAGMVFQINRLGIDTARMYTPGDWTAPQWEKELADNSNPGQADVCGGSLFVATYGTSTLVVMDPATGNQTGTVDLSAYSDGDGVGPEAGSMVEVDGMLYVGLNRLDRDNGWVDAGGKVVEVDCDSKTATQAWDVGGNTSVHAWPDSGKVLVTARAFGDDVGGIYALDPENGVTHVGTVSGEEFSGVAATGTSAVAISLASDYSHYALHCVDLVNSAITSSTNTASYLSGVVANDRGEAWVIASPSWIDAEAPQGITVFDIDSCTETTTAPIELSLAPKDIAFF